MSIFGTIIRKMIERSAKKRSYSEWVTELVESGETVHRHFLTSSDTGKNHNIGGHIIGIERWGQSRLRVFLGDELDLEEYDRFRPAADLDMAEMGGEFSITRQETIALAGKIQQSGISEFKTVPHNDMGGMTFRGWLAYLDGHAKRESGRLQKI